MKKILLLIVVLWVMPIIAFASFDEGKHYEIIDGVDKPKEPTVTEFFSFGCHACFEKEKFIKAFIATKPDSITFNRIHVGSNDKWKLLQKAFVLINLLDRSSHLVLRIFKRVHLDEKPFESDEDIIKYFVEHGFEREKTTELLASPQAKTMIKEFNQLTVNSKITTVPTVIVNNKYIVKHYESPTEFSNLIHYLLAI